ncbi:MAG: transposase [Deltaproteobacteria bacterium]|nr:transposase [Deltaproteobacteria bacterium]
MANHARKILIQAGDMFHVTWQCHNRDFLLSSEFAKQLYYKLLLKYKDDYQMQFYSYCFMDNHPHLTGKCVSQKLMSDFFRVVNSCFAKTMNKYLKRKGQLVMDRFKSPVIETQVDLKKVMIYNDMNPARTVNGTHPKDFRWSSYRHYAYGRKDSLLTDPPCYQELGDSDKERQQAYRKMIQEIFETDERVLQKCPYRNAKGKCLPLIGDPVAVQIKYNELKEDLKHRKKLWPDQRKKEGGN